MKKRSNASYRQKNVGRKKRKIILIVCEGEKTEPNYFDGFRLSVVHAFGTGKNTLSLVDETTRIKKDFEKEYGKDSIESVWCVFDRDIKKDKSNEDDFDNAIRKAEKKGYKVAYSNDSFELWFLLHFKYFDAQITRKQYCEKLTKELNNKYKKNEVDMYNILLERQNMAIKNAEKLEKLHDTNKNFIYHKRNPSTSVYKLVEELNEKILEL